MADIYQRALNNAGLNPSTASQDPVRTRTEIWNVVEEEMPNPYAQDFHMLCEKIYKPTMAYERSGNAEEDEATAHVHLKEPIFITTNSYGTFKSPPIFNIYDALSAIHTMLVLKYGARPWGDQMNGLPPPMHKVLFSLGRCCSVFENRRSQKRDIPTMVGYSVQKHQSDSTKADWIMLGTSAAGSSEQKKSTALARQEYFGIRKMFEAQVERSASIRAQIGYQSPDPPPRPDFQYEDWIYHNCAEGAYFPTPVLDSGSLSAVQSLYGRPIRSDVQIKMRVECRTLKTLKRKGEDQHRLAPNCRNCQSLRDALRGHGIVIEDMVRADESIDDDGNIIPRKKNMEQVALSLVDLRL